MKKQFIKFNSKLLILKYAKKTGAKIIRGIDMFILQGLASINIWEKNDITQRVNFKKIKKVLEEKIC